MDDTSMTPLEMDVLGDFNVACDRLDHRELVVLLDDYQVMLRAASELGWHAWVRGTEKRIELLIEAVGQREAGILRIPF
jgi:hypothetical protein